MISNPATFFTTGSKQESFTYEGGSTLFHFSPHDNGLSRVMDNNIIFFANDKQHALDVLRRMFEFAIKCEYKRLGIKMQGDEAKYIAPATHDRANKWAAYLKALNENKVKVKRAPTNQPFIVGWASNDTLR